MTAGNAVPRRAIRPLAVCLEAAALGVLAMVAANRVDGGPDPVLLGIGWASFAVSAVASIVFAAWSGRLDGSDPRPLPTTTGPTRGAPPRPSSASAANATTPRTEHVG